MIGEVNYPAAELLEAFNYGTGKLIQSLTLLWGQRKDVRELVDNIWDASLIADISTRVLGGAREHAFLEGGFEGLIRSRDNRILRGLILRFSEAYDVNVFTPRAYVVLELCEFLKYLKETVTSNCKESTRSMTDEFEDRRQNLWDNTFGKLPYR